MASGREVTTRGGGDTSSASGMVLGSIRKDPKVDERIIALVQDVGELLYGVDHISKLGKEQLGNWVKRSHDLAKTQGDVSSLLTLLEQIFREVREGDQRVVAAELKDLEDRFMLDARLASRDQAFKEAQEVEERERKTALFDVELTEKTQSTEERAALLEQTLKERETNRKLRWARDVALIGTTGFFAVVSGTLIVYGVINEEIFFVGGSGVAATITLGGIARLAVSWGRGSATKENDDDPA